MVLKKILALTATGKLTLNDMAMLSVAMHFMSFQQREVQKLEIMHPWWYSSEASEL